MWYLEAGPRLEAASRQIFTALVLVLNFSALALALASVLKAGASALALQVGDLVQSMLFIDSSIDNVLR